jgi:glucose-6-phosphate 1-dehydrogenase
VTTANAIRGRASIAPADAAVFVGFGASGDLTRRKLVPALINLRRAGALPSAFAFVAVIRQADVGATLADDVLKAATEHPRRR